jgi:hypothetical protein
VKITIESTTEVIELEYDNGARIPARVWEGETESGIKVQCLITRIAASSHADLAQFESELKEQRAPQMEPRAFPLRMIL